MVTCEEQNACGTTEPASTGSDGAPTTSEGGNPVTGESSGDTGDSPTEGADPETGAESIGTTTGEPVELPLILTRKVDPDYTDVNAILDVHVTADHADGVRMELESGDIVELTPLGAGEFGGEILAYSGLGNGEMTAWFTPWRDALVGETVGAEYVIALPPPGYELYWNADELDIDGNVAKLGVLTDGRPVEFGTYHEMGEPRCYLRLRDKNGEPVEFVDVLPPARCRAIDFTIDRDTGVMHFLVERKKGDDLVWWAGESPGWGIAPKNIGVGEVGDMALALASRPGLVAVCGAKPVATTDKLDALAVLLRPGQQPEERLFDYVNPKKHWFAETARDCMFADAGDTLVLVGEARGNHDGGNFPVLRDRRMVIKHNVAVDDPEWYVGGPGPGVQSRLHAVDVDDQGRYHTVGYTCLDVCEPDGEVRVYSPDGELESQVPMGPLGSAWFGPHDIAWSPAGYAVVAFAELQGQSTVFKVQAFAPNIYEPLWTFTPIDKQGIQIAFAVAVGLFGEVYAGGIGATNHPAFVVIGG
ncbi:MAG: hypothetical protein JNL82_07980 [Myxococcales bacterium]|nr:hypothetical protein [Myxococcales bacterium]